MWIERILTWLGYPAQATAKDFVYDFTPDADEIWYIYGYLSPPWIFSILAMELEFDTVQYENTLEEVKQMRDDLKIKVTTLKDLRQDVYDYMDEHNMETVAVANNVFQKQSKSRCLWNKKALQAFAGDNPINLTEYESANTENVVTYSTKRRKLNSDA